MRKMVAKTAAITLAAMIMASASLKAAPNERKWNARMEPLSYGIGIGMEKDGGNALANHQASNQKPKKGQALAPFLGSPPNKPLIGINKIEHESPEAKEAARIYALLADSLGKSIDAEVMGGADALAKYLLEKAVNGVYRKFGEDSLGTMGYAVTNGTYDCENLAILLVDGISRAKSGRYSAELVSVEFFHIAVVVTDRATGTMALVDLVDRKWSVFTEEMAKKSRLRTADPNVAEYFISINRGYWEMEKGNYDAALALHLKAWEFAKTPEVSFRLSRIYEKLGDMERSEFFKQKTIEINPSFRYLFSGKILRVKKGNA